MRNCEYYQELISRSLDDALSAEERKELAVHLANCPSCSQMWQLMADISGMMKEDTEELPAGLHENIMAGVRRSGMIKANKTAPSGRHYTARKFTITRPVRNLLATAACMAVVIAAALSVNPAGRAENVIAERSVPETVEAPVSQAAAAAPVTAVPTAAPTAQPAPAEDAAAPAGASAVSSAPDTIVTTPAPNQDAFLITPTPRPAPTPTPGNTGTIINKATPSPEPTSVPTPAPTLEPVATEAPAVTPTPAPTEAPAAADVPAAQREGKETEVSAPEEAGSTDAAPAQTELPTESQKAPPIHLFRLIPSLNSLLPENSPEEENTELPEEEDAPAASPNVTPTASPVPTPAPTDAPQPEELFLMDRASAGDLVLLLAGSLDEEGKAPEVAVLPEGPWDESFILELLFDEIPCELTVQIYGQEVYFSLAEIVTEPETEETEGTETGEAPAPSPLPSPAATPETGAAGGKAADGGEAPDEAAAQSFEPQWLLAACGREAFTALLKETMK